MKIKLLLVVIVMLMTIGVRDASAILNIYADANPFVTPGYDINTTTSGIVEYNVFHQAGSTETLDYFQLKFDGSIFSSFSLISALIDGTTPVSFSAVGDLLKATGFGMATGSSMVLRVSYVLVGGASTLTWPEGQPWAQSFVGVSPGFSSLDGGSTGLAPEPGTIMLLGSGLLTLGLVHRYRQRRKSDR